MWRPEDDITADLTSGDPERIATGVRDLELRLDMLDEFPMPPLNLSAILGAFAGDVPPETQLSLFRILTHFQGFEPPLTPDSTRDALVELLLRGGDSRLALELSLNRKTADNPAESVTDAVAAIGGRPLDTPRAIEGAQWFLSYLLAGEPAVRAAALAAARGWPDDPGHRAAVDFIRPELTSDERRQLGLP